MPIQRSEDPARNLHGVWLGPSGSWRWPFDATFTEWGIGSTAFVVLVVMLTFIAPLGLVLAVGALAFARWISALVPADSWAGLLHTTAERARPRARRIGTGLIVALGLLAFPSVSTWLLPMPWVLAVFTALYLATRFVKIVRPHVNGNQPVTYWAKALRHVVHGPRLRRQPVTATPGELSIDITVSDRASDQIMLMEFEMSVLTYDVEEMIVLTYKEKSPTVEAVLFDSRARDPRTCEGVVAWLRARNVNVRTDQITRNSQGVLTSAKIRLVQAGAYLLDNHVIVLEPETGVVRQFTRTEFAMHFEAQRTIEEEVASREVVHP